MAKSDVRRFDFNGLCDALDKKRSSRGMTWSEVAGEIGVATGTLTTISGGCRKETDGILAIIRWLGLTPESFIKNDSGVLETRPSGLKPVPPGKYRRFDTKALYAALDERRRTRGNTWRQLAAEMGNDVAPPMLTRLARGGRIEVTLMVRAVGWLDGRVEDLMHETEW